MNSALKKFLMIFGVFVVPIIFQYLAVSGPEWLQIWQYHESQKMYYNPILGGIYLLILVASIATFVWDLMEG